MVDGGAPYTQSGPRIHRQQPCLWFGPGDRRITVRCKHLSVFLFLVRAWFGIFRASSRNAILEQLEQRVARPGRARPCSPDGKSNVYLLRRLLSRKEMAQGALRLLRGASWGTAPASKAPLWARIRFAASLVVQKKPWKFSLEFFQGVPQGFAHPFTLKARLATPIDERAFYLSLIIAPLVRFFRILKVRH